jgi:hypothetical protein
MRSPKRGDRQPVKALKSVSKDLKSSRLINARKGGKRLLGTPDRTTAIAPLPPSGKRPRGEERELDGPLKAVSTVMIQLVLLLLSKVTAAVGAVNRDIPVVDSHDTALLTKSMLLLSLLPYCHW